MHARSQCPECGERSLYESEEVSAGGGYAPNYLPELGTFWSAAKLRVVICGDCGLTRFFASDEALAKLPQADNWKRL